MDKSLRGTEDELRFQLDCLKEAMEAHGFSPVAFVNDFVGVFIDLCRKEEWDKSNWLENRMTEKEAVWTDEQMENAIAVLGVVADYKIKVMELENSPIFRPKED